MCVGYASAVAGGLTTVLVLPGSANAIGEYLTAVHCIFPIRIISIDKLISPGGQGFVIKLRPTKERSPTSLLVEPPFSLNQSHEGHVPLRWSHIK